MFVKYIYAKTELFLIIESEYMIYCV